VSGGSRSCLISEGILGAMTGAARCPSEEMSEERRALRSSVTLGVSSLPSQAVSWERLEDADLHHLRLGDEAVATVEDRER
jgi:hypothetical protein